MASLFFTISFKRMQPKVQTTKSVKAKKLFSPLLTLQALLQCTDVAAYFAGDVSYALKFLWNQQLVAYLYKMASLFFTISLKRMLPKLQAPKSYGKKTFSSSVTLQSWELACDVPMVQPIFLEL
jgi:hypothetical protein